MIGPKARARLARCGLRSISGAALGSAVVLVVLGGPAPAARAHAAFVSSQPPPGAELASAPGVVVLRFTEPLNTDLSRATVTSPGGEGFEAPAASEREIRIPLGTNAPGIYAVDWTTVSIVDGHTLRGSFRFGVGVAVGPGGEGFTGTAPSGADLAVAALRAVEYAALLAVLGMLLLERLGRRAPSLQWVRVPLVAATTVAFVAGLAVVLGEALTAAPSPSFRAIGAYLGGGPPGLARLGRLAAEALMVAAVRVARPPVGVLVVGAMAGLAAAGHAAAARPAWQGIAVDALHLIAAGLWAGGILALATLRPPGGWRGPEARVLLQRFSPVAIPAFLTTVGFGVLRGAQELGGLRDLLTTSYGQVLTAKVLGVLAMIPLSVIAWRRRRGSPRAEGVIALTVVAAAALLAAYPLPPGRLEEAEAARQAPVGVRALPRAGDLTMGGEAGEVLIGLTVRPGRPGPNEVLVYLLPLGGEEAARDVQASMSLDGGRHLPLEECGMTCRSTTAVLDGGEEVTVRVGGPAGGATSLRIPRLPPPDGRPLLEQIQARMHQLSTYRLDETLRPVDPPLRARYAFQAPDRMRLELSTASQTIQIGRKAFRREGPDARWRSESALPLKVPTFIWDGRDYVAPLIVGTDRVKGIPTTILSFLGSTGSIPIWFRLWADHEGLVRRAEMRAQGHFMDHRYFAFDAPLEVRPPAGAN